MSDQQPPELQLVEQGGGQPSTLVTLSGAGTPEDHFMHDEMTTEMKLTLGKVDTNVQTLLSTVNDLASQLAAIQSHLSQIENGLTGIGKSHPSAERSLARQRRADDHAEGDAMN